MKVILTKDVKGLGHVDDVVNAAEGYARNYLFPRNLAIPADKANMAELEKRRKVQEAKEERSLDEAKELAGKLSEVQITIEAKTGAGTKLYGSITTSDIAEALEKQAKIKVDRRKIELDDPIKSLGSYEVPVRLHREAVGQIKVEVVGEPAKE